MYMVIQEDISLETQNELISPPSPKRPRTDCTLTNNHGGKFRFDFSEVLTFQKNTVSPSTTLQKDVGFECTAEAEDTEDDKTDNPLQDISFILSPLTKLVTSHTENANAGQSNACCFTSEENFLLLVKDEQPPVNETDKLSSNSAADAGEALAAPHTPKKAGADTSSHPDCGCLGKSVEDEPPGGCNLPAGNEKDGRQVQSSVSQIQEYIFSSSDVEVRCQSDCTSEDALSDTSFSNTWGQSAVAKESNQKGSELVFSENLLFCKEKEAANSPIIFNDLADSECYSSQSLTEGVKTEEEISELQIFVNEIAAAYNGETKGQVNETGMCESSIRPADDWAEGSIVSYDAVLARNTGNESVSEVEADDFCCAKETPAAGERIAKTESETADRTRETPGPARISQEPARGDNDAGLFSVIDPAIWSESDREAEETHCNSESTQGVELSPTGKVCEIEIPLCPDIWPSQQVSAPQQIRTKVCSEEKGDSESYTEPLVCCTTTDTTTQHKTGNNSDSLYWRNNPSSSTCWPANALRESDDTLDHQSACSLITFDNLEYLWLESTGMEVNTDLKEKKETSSEIESAEDRQLETSGDLKEKTWQQYEEHEDTNFEISTVDLTNDFVEGDISDCGNILANIQVDLKNNLEFPCVHPNIAVIPIKETTTGEKERQEEDEQTDESGSLEMLGDSDGGCFSESREDDISKSGDKFVLFGPHEQRNKLSCFSDCQQRTPTDDLLAFRPSCDAVVPGPYVLNHSQNDPTAFLCRDSISSVPSANLSSHVQGPYDTFEKILLPVHDKGDDDIGLSSSPLLTCLPVQLLKTPQQTLYRPRPKVESNEHEEGPTEEEKKAKEEEMARFKGHTDNIANGLPSSDYSCDELSNFISAADVPALSWLEQYPKCESACNSSACFLDELKPQSPSSTVSTESEGPASDVKDRPKFEMKTQFDKVLKELNLFFDVSRSDFASDSRASSPDQQCSDVTEAWERNIANYEDHPVGELKDTTSDDADEDHSLDVCGVDPVVSHTPASVDREQEVPLGSQHLEASMQAAEEQKEPGEMEQKRKMWSPSFMCQTLLEKLSHRPAQQPMRLEPLKTCTRPLRVGLSKRAKTKHLHRPHPYK